MESMEVKCPYCAESIEDEAIKCPFCGEWFDKRAAHPGSIQHQAAINAEATASRLEHRHGADAFGGCLFVPFFFGGIAAGVWWGSSFWLGMVICLVVWGVGFSLTNKASNAAFKDRMARDNENRK